VQGAFSLPTDVKHGNKVIDEQEFDVLFKPAQGEDVIPDGDGARCSEDVPGLTSHFSG